MGFIYGLLSSAAFGLIPPCSPCRHPWGMPAPLVLFYLSLPLPGGIPILRGERFPHQRAFSLPACGHERHVRHGRSAHVLGFCLYAQRRGRHLQVFIRSWLCCSDRLFPRTVLLDLRRRRGPGPAGRSPSGGGAGGRVQPVVVALLLVSALCNAIYITAIFAARIPHMSGLVMTFYVLALGGLLSLANCLATGVFRPLRSWRELGLALLLAVITAVISNLTLILAVQRIGSTLASVLGVMEPLTAVLVGVCVFHEPFTPPIAGGVAFIVASVILVLLGDKLRALGARLHRRPQ